MLYILVFITGFCSMMYEVALAQLLSSLLGNTALRYATTLGFYITAMGIGSIVYKSTTATRDRRLFFWAEIGLCSIAAIAPFVFIGIYRLANSHHSSEFLILSITHIFIAVVGFLSGFELPILSSLSERNGAQRGSLVLGLDYFGMFAAAIAFPLIIYPTLGVFTSLWLTTALNLLAAAMTLFLKIENESRPTPRAREIALIGAYCIFNFALLFFNEPIAAYLGTTYAL